MIRKLLLGIVVTAGILALSTGAYAEGGGGDGTLFVPSEYATIAAALANADAGDTIDIAAAGSPYAEGDLVVDKQLTIQGAGSATTIIDASGASTDYGILLEAGGISAVQRLTIEGLTIKNSPSHGIKAYKAGGLNLDHVTLEDLVLTLNGVRGMEIHNDVAVSDMEITDCEFVNNVAQGLRTASNVTVDGMVITDSQFDGNSYGIYLQGTINGVTIVRSTFNNSVGGYGGYMTETGPLTNLIIEDSEFNSNVVGLMVWNEQDNADITITGTSFQDNDKWGVLIWGATLTNVLIQDSSVLSNDGLGIGYYGIDFNTYDGAMTNVAVHCTNIIGHTVGGGVKNRNTVDTAIVDATCNWWGAADGPSGSGSGSGDAVTDNVTFAPWLLAPASPTCSCEPPTFVVLSSFTASPSHKRVILEWSTGSEVDNLGFNLYRAESEDGEYTQINGSLILAEGSSNEGASYEFVDRNVRNRKTYWYKLEDVDIYNTRTQHGPVSVTPRLIHLLLT